MLRSRIMLTAQQRRQDLQRQQMRRPQTCLYNGISEHREVIESYSPKLEPSLVGLVPVVEPLPPEPTGATTPEPEAAVEDDELDEEEDDEFDDVEDEADDDDESAAVVEEVTETTLAGWTCACSNVSSL